jgi:signal transduction histidine kinase
LDLAKVEAGEIRLHEAPVDLALLINETAALVRPPGQDSKVHLATRVDRDLPKLMGDELRIKQILLNLLSNAMKFTDDGLVVARAELVEGAICLTVEDSGKGMNEADIEVALLPFGQVENEMLTSPSEGTGLGLPLTRSMAELHQATMLIDSDKGKGTRVRIIFPRERTLPIATASALAS